MAGIELIRQLPILTNTLNPAAVMNKIMVLTIEHHLTTYDAAYLKLAVRLNLPLATKDDDLRKAANKLGVLIFPK